MVNGLTLPTILCHRVIINHSNGVTTDPGLGLGLMVYHLPQQWRHHQLINDADSNKNSDGKINSNIISKT
jgi:hypothetical protein